MNMLQIKYFVTVAKYLSFTKAAEHLFVTQPALSRQIKNMEEELNLQLFVRTTSGIRLTPAGSSLFLGMQDMYDNYNAMVEKAKTIQTGISGTLKVGVLDQVDVADFMPLITKHFKENYPNVDVIYETASFEKLISGLYSGQLDIAFTLRFEVENKESILFYQINKSKDYICMSRYNELAKKEKVELRDCADETFIMISKEDNPESSELIVSLCKEQGFVPKIKFANTLAEQILFIEAGDGVSILDDRTSLQHNPNISFFEIDTPWDPSTVAAWHQNNYNPMISIFMKKLNEVLDIEPVEERKL